MADGSVIDSGKESRSQFVHVNSKTVPQDLTGPFLEIDKSRHLIVGVIPHTQCIPKSPACGFCTFPHDQQNKRLRNRQIRHLASSIREVIEYHGESLAGREVDAIYFGGGTANLSSVEEIQDLAKPLIEYFHTTRAEVSLEGIPSLFAAGSFAHLTALAELPVRHRRISMGIQTFDSNQLWKMGRQSFGDRKTIAGVVGRAHELSLTASGDLLFGLPHQSLDQMLDDVDQAVNCDLDQICLYHLVLYSGLGTPWSLDLSKVNAMKEPSVMVDYWLALRQRLLENGYVQTTLTNFERKEVHTSDRRFIYEEASFNPDAYDAVGFGPLSVSTFIDYSQNRGIKLLRRKHYRAPAWSNGDLYFPYELPDLKLLWITRCLAGLRLDRQRYRARFGSDIAEDFPAAFSASTEAGLLESDENRVSLTPRGMYFSDAVIGTFAANRTSELRVYAAGLRTQTVLDEKPATDAGFYLNMG